VTLQGQPQGGSDVPIHQNSDPVSDLSLTHISLG
jgi:hypothetical protein